MTKWLTPAFTNRSNVGMTSSGVPTAVDDRAIASGILVAALRIFTIHSWLDIEYSVKYFTKSNPSISFRPCTRSTSGLNRLTFTASFILAHDSSASSEKYTSMSRAIWKPSFSSCVRPCFSMDASIWPRWSSKSSGVYPMGSQPSPSLPVSSSVRLPPAAM